MRLDPGKKKVVDKWIDGGNFVFEDKDTLKKRIAKFGGDEKKLEQVSEEDMVFGGETTQNAAMQGTD